MLDFSKLVREAKRGGFTVDTRGQSPRGGFAVSVYPRLETRIPVSALDDRALLAFQSRNANVLRRAGHYFGAWRNGNDIVLDVSIVTDSLQAAQRLARDRGQLAIFDIAEGMDIYL